MAMTITTAPVATSGGAAQFPSAQPNNGNADLANMHQEGVQKILKWQFEGEKDQTKANRIKNLDYYPRAPDESCMTLKTKRIIAIVLIIVGIAAMVIGTGLLAGFGFAAFVAAAGTAVTVITTLALIALGMVSVIYGYKMYKASRTTEQANEDFVDEQIAARQKELDTREPEEMHRQQLDVDDDDDKDELYEEGVLKGELKPDERGPSYFRTAEALNKVLPAMHMQQLNINRVLPLELQKVANVFFASECPHVGNDDDMKSSMELKSKENDYCLSFSLPTPDEDLIVTPATRNIVRVMQTIADPNHFHAYYLDKNTGMATSFSDVTGGVFFKESSLGTVLHIFEHLAATHPTVLSQTAIGLPIELISHVSDYCGYSLPEKLQGPQIELLD